MEDVVGAVLSFVAVITPWIVFATIYFGSPVPQSAKAKSGWISQHLTLLHRTLAPATSAVGLHLSECNVHGFED